MVEAYREATLAPPLWRGKEIATSTVAADHPHVNETMAAGATMGIAWLSQAWRCPALPLIACSNVLSLLFNFLFNEDVHLL